MSQNQVRKFDLGDLETTSPFYGREKELEDLQQSISSGCRLIALLGMEGIGKTSLAVKLANNIQGEFDYVIGRSLKDAPPLTELLESLLLQLLSNQAKINTSNSIDIGIARLKDRLNNNRCLLLLDDAEAILQNRELVGKYRKGYEDYDKLLNAFAYAPHLSCLLIISSEKPKFIELLKQKTKRVQSFKLLNLDDAAAKKLFKEKGFSDSEELTTLINLYQGNPLYLKLVLTIIQEVFGGNVSDFLFQEATLDFDNIYDILENQFQRLSDLEKQIMYFLGSKDHPVSFHELRNNSCFIGKKFTDAIKSLDGRGLIKNIESKASYTLQSMVVIKYIKRKLRNYNKLI
ncbi:ATP-binding protein [Anabaena sp. WFMT]|uniref:ATP-binding protein n=1 Tax=Anabaena sp. WFMT TaxID=3449730 RepID=UPI003F21F00C